MTVETTVRKQNFAGGQSSLNFAFKTLVSHPEYIKVKITETATGTVTDLTYNVDYTVALASDGVGGTVTVSPSFSTAYTQTVYRETINKQESTYDDYNQFPASTVEADFDRRTLIEQETAEETARTLRYPITASAASTELPSPEADSFIAWNSAGTALENKEIPDPSTLVKASQAIAEAATNDTNYMTPLQVKNEVQKSGAVSIPAANIGALALSDIDDAASIVQTSGTQTVGGVKTFTSFPVTPSSAPTTDYQVSNKKYIDDKLNTSTGHDHDGSDSKKVIATNLDMTGITYGHYLYNNAGTLAGQAGGFLTSVVITTSTTWTCPSGVTRVFLSMCGGGGGGGGGNGAGPNGGCGGAGGSYVLLYPYTVAAGAYTVTIGAGGAGGGASTGGSNGGATSFDTFSVSGGPGGLSTPTASTSGIGSYNATTMTAGTIYIAGGSGAAGSATGDGWGAGGSGPFGLGASTGGGAASSGFGGGGAGGIKDIGGSVRGPGGDGKAGICIIYY